MSLGFGQQQIQRDWVRLSSLLQFLMPVLILGTFLSKDVPSCAFLGITLCCLSPILGPWQGKGFRGCRILDYLPLEPYFTL